MFSSSIARRAASAAACRSFARPRTAALAMPLRAKLLPQHQQPPSAAQRPQTKGDAPPQDDPEDVLFHTLYGMRFMELHRPKKLNALDLSMIKKIEAHLLEWAKSDMANVIIMKGAGDRAFCAGGDVATLAKWNKAGNTAASVDYFRREYELDYLIATYSKPLVAFMDGITMGGGVGLSMHAPFRIATERTVFAMPETTIGFFPDVGASFFLPRLPGAVGTYLALTSERLTGANVFYAGLASHYLHSTSLPALESRLAELRFADYDGLPVRLAAVNRTIEEFCTGLPHDQPILLGGPLRAAIDRTFSPPTVPGIVATLEAESDPANPHGPAAAAWAQKTLKTLLQRSPTSLHVTRKQMQLGARWDLAMAFRREYQMAARFMRHSDFTEGVDARLISKREPRWNPASLKEEIGPEQRGLSLERGGVDWYFGADRELEPLRLQEPERQWKQHGTEEKPRSALFALPSERDVEQMVAREDLTRKAVMKRLLVETGMKQGVREVVGEILERKTKVDDKGFARWVYDN